MSIASEITRLQNAKAALKESITAKGVTVEDSAKLDEYPALVDNISSGNAPDPNADVIFIDYDGTLIASYSKEDFASLQSFPELPTHEGLLNPEWNWTLSGAKNYVSQCGSLIIGASYQISDVGICIYIKVCKPQTTITTSASYQSLNQCEIDWGDGTTPSKNTGTGNDCRNNHTYSDAGVYKIHLYNLEGYEDKTIMQFRLYSHNNIYVSKVIVNHDYITLNISSFCDYGELWIGKYGNNFSCSTSATWITKILLSKNFNRTFSFEHTNSTVQITSLVFPKNENASIAAFSCVSGYISISENLNSFSGFSQSYKNNITRLCLTDKCYGAGKLYKGNIAILKQISLLSGGDTIEENFLAGVYGDIEKLVIPSSVTTIGNMAFINCLIRDLFIGSGITSIGSNVFNRTYKLTITATTPPTITSSSFSSAYISEIYVPAESVDTYKGTTNWSAYAGIIQAIPTT